MAGHLAIKRTMQKVLSEFYWPGINSDIHVQSAFASHVIFANVLYLKVR